MTVRGKGVARREPVILCPRCEYRPQPEDRWRCLPRCGTNWHTFWTAGVCPGCGLSWPVTQCPACGRVSPHRAWYREPDPEPGAEQEQEREAVTVEGVST